MNTGCSGCIAALPRMDSLTKLFKSRVSIFVSTPQDPDKVNYFKSHNAIGQKVSLPFITKDTLLEKYFPHVYISHIVWIYKGVVVAITHSDYVSEKNIREVLSGAVIRWPVKRDVTDYDYSSPLFSSNKAAIPEFSLPQHIWYTAFTSHLDNITPRYSIYYDSLSHTTRITAINYSLLQLCLKAFGLPPNYGLSRIAADTALQKYFLKSNDGSTATDWKNQYTFCYETQIEGCPSDSIIQKKLNLDIETQFGITAYSKSKSMDCWVLVYDSSKQKIPFDKFTNYATAKKSNETSIWSLLYRMNHTFYHPPVINKSLFGAQQYIKAKEENLTDITAVNSLLADYGLTFKVVQKEIPILFIKEK